MQDNSSRPDRLPADLGASLRKAALGSPEAPLLSLIATAKATSRQKKAKLAKMNQEERRAAEAARKEEAKLARAEARLRQSGADWALLHKAKRCWTGCVVCRKEKAGEIPLSKPPVLTIDPCPRCGQVLPLQLPDRDAIVCAGCWTELVNALSAR
jgi:hypothetical protein